MAIQKVGVVGCGLMGSGIAQVCAASGFATVVREVNGELLDKGLTSIDKNLNRLAEKGAITEAVKGEIRGRLKGTTVIEDLKNCDVIIEAIIDRNGNVTDARVLKPLPLGLDASALEAVKRWKFKPGTLNGQPVPVIYNLTVNFRLQ